MNALDRNSNLSATCRSRISQTQSKGQHHIKSSGKVNVTGGRSQIVAGRKIKSFAPVANTYLHRPPAEVTGIVRDPKRGIFYASELLHHRDTQTFSREFRDYELACFIRFPPGIASLLQQRLMACKTILDSQTASLNFPPETNEAHDLGLSIIPTNKEDFRLFEISVEKHLGNPASAIKLWGLLVEMPCIIEAYKSVDSNLLFKANDLSQMIYTVYRTSDDYRESFNLEQIRDRQLWEWHSGLTPGTHRIRHRRFKNFNLVEKADIAAAEKEICKLLNAKNIYENPQYEAATEYLLEEHLNVIESGKDFESKNVMAVIGPQNPILYAILNKLSLKDAIVPFKEFVASEAATLLCNAQNTPLSQNSRITAFSPNNRLKEDELIPDHLSDILFDEMPTFVDTAQEAAELEEEIQTFISAQTAKDADDLSDASFSSEENPALQRQARKSKKFGSKIS